MNAKRSVAVLLALAGGALVALGVAWWWALELDAERLAALAEAHARIAELEHADEREQAREAGKLKTAAAGGALVSVALELALDPELAPFEHSQRLAEAFREARLDLLAGSSEQACELWRERGEIERFAPLVDQWIGACIEARRVDKAERLREVLLAVDTDPARTSLRRAMAKGALDEARAVEFDAKRAASTARLFGRVLRGLGAPQDALPALRTARLARSNDVELLLELAACLRAAGSTSSERCEVLAVAVTLRPGSARLHSAWAEALLERGEHERALAVCGRALEIAPAEPFACEVATRALFDVGRTDEALNTLRRAVSSAPNDPALRTRFGRWLARARQDREASANLELALELAPDRTDTLLALSELLATSRDSSVRDEARAGRLAARATELGLR
ncbi:MAG: hypothetical protein IT454_16980 [Planctomycetes bacterium]|nr:hypothetical protein [Planctomycetota bacterium]